MTDNDKKKQIEEMAKDVTGSIDWCRLEDDFITVDCFRTAEALYEMGYRKQRDGENIGAVHPVDEFKCAVCGITLEGWTRVVTDEDDGELYYYEYEFKYCPNCGAKMKGEHHG